VTYESLWIQYHGISRVENACVVFLLCVVTAIASPGQTFTTLVNFKGTNGAAPQPEGLLQGTDGNLYGTTLGGGASGVGTVFKVTPTGRLTTLHSFDYSDGWNPAGGLVQDTDGNFYGTTQYAYTNTFLYGTVFKLAPDGTLTTLHQFKGEDGFSPNSRLFQASDGSFYGTTAYGGGNFTKCFGEGCGTVFHITPAGELATLYNFCS
jgi:uncharacterized repeat protein (TIGR03803 family)